MSINAALLTTWAMVAFALNSVLARAALANGALDGATFTGIRLLAGAVVLLPWVSRPPRDGGRPGLWGALSLVVYAAFFSFAYRSVDTGTGALLLFGAVQITMVVAGAAQGERPTRYGLIGMVIASGGLVLLCLPGVSAPPLDGAILMLLSGVGWGVYSHLGRGQSHPEHATAVNFMRAIPASLVLLGVGAFTASTPSTKGVLLAATSGALTSGLGYVIWYRALRHHSSTSAAAVQLSAPLLALLGGAVMLGEAVSLRIVVGGVLVLGGIVVCLRGDR